ncbi:MAG TPA: DALR anticodon-binding domain-containing protein, partial [Thermosynergistes sp.]|nr:DALR anticodon-binding domain-containing protein [Thermosynergistes sp.]
LAVSIAWHRPLQALLLLERLFALKDEEWFEDLVTSAVRVRNILTKASSFSAKLEEGDLKLEAERELYEAVKEINPLVNDCLKRCDWEGLMKLLSRLSPVISRFFDEVFVMSEDAQERQSRLSLLSLCNDLFRTLGDLGSLKGSKEAATRGQDSE